MQCSPVPTALVHTSDDGIDELIGEAIFLSVSSEIPIDSGFAVRSAEEENLMFVYTVELVVAIEGDILEHERQDRLARSLTDTGDLVVADEVGCKK